MTKFIHFQETVVTEYLNKKSMDDAVNGIREMKAPKHFLPEMLSKIIVCSLERSDEDKEQASALINTLRTEGLVSGENFMQVWRPYITCMRDGLDWSSNS